MVKRFLCVSVPPWPADVKSAIMLNRAINSLNNRVLVIALACALGAWGWWAAGATPIDAIPDLSDNQVIVFTEWPGTAHKRWKTRSPTRSRSTSRG